MNQMALEKLEEKKLITEYEKNKLSHQIIGLTQNNSKIRNNLTDTRNQVSTLLADFFKYNSSLASIGLVLM
jgi:FtsZ-binding cell division protein ZapB